MRLSVPDVPYTPSECEIIFRLFLSQLKLLKSKDEELEDYHTFLLNSLNTVKSARLIVTVDSEELFLDYFEGISQLINEVSKDFQAGLLDVLEQIIHQLFFEDKEIPKSVLELIFNNMDEKRQKENPQAYAMTKSLCRNNSDSLQPSVAKYFSEFVLPSKKKMEPSEEKENLKLVVKAHKLIKLINSAAPTLLLAVMPQLELSLNDEKEKLRQLSTETLGSIFAGSDSNLASRYLVCWKSWLKRRFDKAPIVRISWVQQCSLFYEMNSPYINEISNCLEDKILDVDEKVRSACCATIDSLEYLYVKEVVPESLLRSISKRIRDKKHSVRVNSINLITKLFNWSYEDQYSNDLEAIEKFSWIPDELLDAMYTNEKDIILLCEIGFRKNILESLKSTNRANKLLFVLSKLTEKSYKAFIGMLNKQQGLTKDMHIFIETCKKLGGEIKKYSENDEQLIQLATLLSTRITDFLPNSQASAEELLKYSSNNDPIFNSLVGKVLNSSLSISTLNTSAVKALERIEIVAPNLKSIFENIFIKLSPSLIHQSLIPSILAKIKIKNNTSKYNELPENHRKIISTAEEYLSDIAEIYPILFGKHILDISDILNSEKCNKLKWLKTLSKYCLVAKKTLPVIKELNSTLENIITNGTPQESKYAAISISCLPNADQQIDTWVNRTVDNLDLKSDKLATHLKALAQLIKYSTFYVEQQIENIMKFVFDKLLIKNLKDVDVDGNTFNTEELPGILQAKLYAISFLVNRVDYYANNKKWAELAKPVFFLLWAILEKDGELQEENDTPNFIKSHLRIKAATSILKLAKHPNYFQYISPRQFILLAQTIQDPYLYVRERFSLKLIKYLRSQILPTKFVTILFCAAHEGDYDLKSQITSFCKTYLSASKIGKRSAQLIEGTIARLIHLLAHDPEFSNKPSSLKLFAKYFEFFLSCIATSENISYIYSIAGRVKSLEDCVDPSKNENLYALSDLCQYVINLKKDRNHWVVETYPVEIKLPKELFNPLPYNQQNRDNLMKSFLPSEFQDDSIHFMKPPEIESTPVQTRSKDDSKRKNTEEPIAKRSKKTTKADA
ncbi:hypothetical protein K502DRAFT_322465 [Neoconidiobolus thromboides FSU 785]|nr:hypothetical protein K502DRAFT_322465 [Neoconidiobolus thromboides FSU 785]